MRECGIDHGVYKVNVWTLSNYYMSYDCKWLNPGKIISTINEFTTTSKPRIVIRVKKC